MVVILSTVSTEPVMFMIAITNGIKYGAGIVDALLFDKVCLYELGYTEEICENLSLYEDEEIEVQETVNRFNLGKSMAETVLSIISSLLVGGFVDRYGFKITLTMAFIGFYEFISALRADINSIRGLRPLMILQVGLWPTVTFHGLKEAPGEV